ncbi:MAG TPA: type II CAAX endopeptidase family protein [Candidatus Limnocylindrales bacterium]
MFSVAGLMLAFVGFASLPPVSGVLLMGGLLLLTIGLSSAAGYQVVVRSSRPASMFHGPSPLIVFAVQLVIVNIATVLLIVFGIPVLGNGVAFIIDAIVLLAGYVLVVWLYGFRTGALDLRAIGLPVGGGASRWLTDIGFGAVVMLFTALVVGVWGSIIAQLLNSNTPDVVPAPTTALETLFVVLGACILIPIGEELLFRGYSFTAWLRDLGPRSALIRTTLFFGLAHILNITVDQNQNGAALDGLKQALLEFLVIAPVGFVLGWIFLRRGLLASIAGHAAFNLYGVLLLILYQGTSIH